MNKLIILLVSASALSLAACGDQTAQNTTPATPPASTDASKTATADPAKPAGTVAPAVDPAKPADTKIAAGDAAKPATTPTAPMAALDPQIQTMIDGLKAKVATMSADQKTKSVADVRTAAEGMAKTAGKSDADVKSMGDAAEAAAKTALGV